ncbi:glycosyltransferase (GT2) [Formosa agariphila KMM 3901]|uniref:Glycosyltransferase (GT2) n=1 Tax=Formosa agariphila (strain DSM 15362 / KCTC 12365 / LMG 23005 / KMM 3901 / M-2Alg 35-1) TaxID=1347342 RepID=T2KQG7_FORAG|nr:glycosyltransferase family A protein [Formosa agariphila]CDF80229.1 glycosyltransferase (GT2) [Formosa agariphila KMM 3901]
MQPFFSIIIPLYNKQKHITNTISSVTNQSFKDFEVIIINDGSTDQSLALVNTITDSRLKVYNITNHGVSYARNYGIKKANSDNIALLDGDDFWHTDYLKTMYNLIKKFPEEAVFSCAIAHHYSSKTSTVPYNFKLDDNVEVKNYFKNSVRHSLLSSSSIVFKKAILSKTDWFDESLKSGEDTDMWIRIGINYPIVFIAKVLVYYVYDDSSLSNTSFDITYKPKYDNYLSEESKNRDVKIFIDKNRFSMAILSKLNANTSAYNFYRTHLDVGNLKTSQKILLFCPAWLLKVLLKLKALSGKKVYFPPLNAKNSG